MTVIFVGDKPSSKNISDRAFVGANCYPRLLGWLAKLNLSINDVYMYNRTHLTVTTMGHIQFYDGYTIVGVELTDRIVALGKEASKYLSALEIDHCTLPHPSGLNRQINDESYVNEQLQKCKEYLDLSSIVA